MEGLLSTGPTPSSFYAPRCLYSSLWLCQGLLIRWGMSLGNFFQHHNHHNHDGNLLWPDANVDNVDNYNFVVMALVVLWVWWKGWWSVCCGWWWWRITLPQSTPQNTTTINTTTIPTTIIFTDTKHSFTQYCSNLWILGRHRGRQGGSPPQVGDVGPDGEVLHQYNKH